MHHGIAAANAGAQRFEIEQIAGHHFSSQSVQIVQVAGAPHQQAHGGTASGQLAGDMAADEASGAGDEDLHLVPLPPEVPSMLSHCPS